MLRGDKIAKAEGKLGVLLPGMGAVTTTFIAGVESVRKGLHKPFGSLTQLGTIRLGKRTDKTAPFIKDFVPITDLSDIVFGGWDIFEDDMYAAAKNSGVLKPEDLEPIKGFLSSIHPMKAVFDQKYVKNLEPVWFKDLDNKYDLAEALRQDIKDFKEKNGLARVVIVWAASTEAFIKVGEVHQTLESFEQGMKDNHDDIAPSMLYAWAALKEKVPFANGAPNLTTDIPALYELADINNVPLSGKDFKTGQTLMKTIVAPGLKARLLGLNGWFSTNILGNRDGEVLDDPASFKTKEESKLSVLEHILQPEMYPDLYGNFYHKVRINYYPPRGDDKEGWDSIDIFGWMSYPMQIKIDFLCRDSILAAPLLLDLALFMDLASRAEMGGIQEWLSFYFKSPIVAPELYPEHDLFIQQSKLKNTLRYMMEEEQITHLGIEYYEK